MIKTFLIFIILFSLSMTAQAQLKTLNYHQSDDGIYIAIGFVHKDSIIEFSGGKYISQLSFKPDSFENSVACLVRTDRDRKEFVLGVIDYKYSRKIDLNISDYFIEHLRDYCISIKDDGLYYWVDRKKY